ncbi:MAG TPA: hypothetical protein QGF95_06660 [Candidatus Latescibacteria bacterium]|nr:hypothetical protein [Gemmatimonadaceae bacterium]MDP6017399.1 hypothetical protein [Candidatus Latescibacterota bacterium]HJP30218.1 hypothetical protein [Candidatus Latescibacterota bacterium]
MKAGGTIRMSTDRVRHVLSEISSKDLDMQVCPAQDVPGPGGGVYITKQTPLTLKHLEWLETRNPSLDGVTYVDVHWVQGSRQVDPPAEIDRPDTEEPAAQALEERAQVHAKRVAGAAREVADQAAGIYRSLGKADFTVGDLRRTETDASLRQFERSFTEFHGAVKKALDEYLHGNTLVMDMILRFQLDRETVRHALSVAAFATEMATQLALRQDEDEAMTSYFGEATDDDIRNELGLSHEEAEVLSATYPGGLRMNLFREELVEVFLGGFMHDCGLWMEPFNLPEGHEVKGAKLISETREVERFAPALAKIVLFHSDIVRLARKHGLVKITDSPDDPTRMNFRREFYDQHDDAAEAAELYSGNAHADVLSTADLRKVLPVALAEYYISHTRDVYTKSEVEVINDLSQHVRGGAFQRYMVVLCNSRVEVVAPRRALVRLEGHLSVMVEKGKDSRRAVRLEVDGFDAGSLHHGRDRNSPHLITLFLARRDGSREKAEYVNPRDGALWDRAAGIDSRMYIAGGRHKNNLSCKVTGFMGEEVYARVLGEYEQEFERRN